MPIGGDTRYDETWSEIEKIQRRRELRYRLKEEGIRKRYDPFLMFKNERYSDPAINRYGDLRKVGRLPGTPLSPKLFYGTLALLFLPLYVMRKLSWWELEPKFKALKSGEIPFEERWPRNVG